MRAFSTLIIAAALALSANAAALDKRAVSAPVQLCIDDINSVAAQLAVVKADVSSVLYLKILYWLIPSIHTSG
mgnify:FL=1